MKNNILRTIAFLAIMMLSLFSSKTQAQSTDAYNAPTIVGFESKYAIHAGGVLNAITARLNPKSTFFALNSQRDFITLDTYKNGISTKGEYPYNNSAILGDGYDPVFLESNTGGGFDPSNSNPQAYNLVLVIVETGNDKIGYEASDLANAETLYTFRHVIYITIDSNCSASDSALCIKADAEILVYNTDASKQSVQNVIDAIYGEQNASVSSATSTEANTLSVYPNPSTSQIRFSDSKQESLKIYDALGRLIMTSETNRVVNVSAFTQGTYFASTQTKTCAFTVTK